MVLYFHLYFEGITKFSLTEPYFIYNHMKKLQTFINEKQGIPEEFRNFFKLYFEAKGAKPDDFEEKEAVFSRFFPALPEFLEMIDTMLEIE